MKYGKNIPNIESATRQAIKEAEELEIFLEELALNSENNEIPDLDSHFKYLDGEFKNVYEYTPVKSYGPGRPSLLRLYAIKLAPNKYVITGGGIKLGDKIQTSPGIKDFVLKDIRRVRKYLTHFFGQCLLCHFVCAQVMVQCKCHVLRHRAQIQKNRSRAVRRPHRKTT